MHTPPERVTAFANFGDVKSSILNGNPDWLACCANKTTERNIAGKNTFNFFIFVSIYFCLYLLISIFFFPSKDKEILFIRLFPYV
jgi:hypothetical protein